MQESEAAVVAPEAGAGQIVGAQRAHDSGGGEAGREHAEGERRRPRPGQHDPGGQADLHQSERPAERRRTAAARPAGGPARQRGQRGGDRTGNDDLHQAADQQHGRRGEHREVEPVVLAHRTAPPGQGRRGAACHCIRRGAHAHRLCASALRAHRLCASIPRYALTVCVHPRYALTVCVLLRYDSVLEMSASCYPSVLEVTAGGPTRPSESTAETRNAYRRPGHAWEDCQ